VITTCAPGRRTSASGEDALEPCQEAVVADVGEVPAVEQVAVEVVVLLHAAPGDDRHLPVGGRSVGRGGDHERGLPDEVGWEQRGQLAGVAVEHLGRVEDRRVGAVVAGEVEVGTGDVDPVRLVLDADRAAPEMDGLDEGGADPAHRVQDEVPGARVVGDGVGGDGGQHLRRVRGRARGVAVAALAGGRLLRGGPHRQRQVLDVGDGLDRERFGVGGVGHRDAFRVGGRGVAV
jgi:hypothetical protein